MRQSAAIGSIVRNCQDRLFVCANGLISRWAFASAPTQTFCMLGSMGMSANIALGIALVQPDRSLGIIDGDGNLLMDSSAILAIGSAKHVTNLTHFNLNNQEYASTGHQPSIATAGLFARVARSAGYDEAVIVRTEGELEQFCATVRTGRGRVFCEVLIGRSPEREPGRVELSCEKIAKSFASKLSC